MAAFMHPGLQTIFSALAMEQWTLCNPYRYKPQRIITQPWSSISFLQPLLAHCFDFPVSVLSSWTNNKTLDFLWAMSKCHTEGLLGGHELTRAVVRTSRTHFVVQIKASGAEEKSDKAADRGLQQWSSGGDHTAFSSTKRLWMHLGTRWVWAGLKRNSANFIRKFAEKKENFLVPEKHTLTFPNLFSR